MLSMKLPMHSWVHVNFNRFALYSWQCIKPVHWSLRLFHINMACRTHQGNWRWNGRTVVKELCWVSQLTVLTRQYKLLKGSFWKYNIRPYKQAHGCTTVTTTAEPLLNCPIKFCDGLHSGASWFPDWCRMFPSSVSTESLPRWKSSNLP